MIRLNEVVIVEGKYDTIRLRSAVDALILETNGFGIFKDREKQALLRRLAKERGLLILTDSDTAGFIIRNYLSEILPADEIKHAYIPPLPGKEKRKAHRSKEGLLGVEGLEATALERAIRAAGVVPLGESAPNERGTLTKTHLFEDGLSGRPDSARRRQQFLAMAGLPVNLSANRLLAVLNATMTEAQYRDTLSLIQ